MDVVFHMICGFYLVTLSHLYWLLFCFNDGVCNLLSGRDYDSDFPVYALWFNAVFHFTLFYILACRFFMFQFQLFWLLFICSRYYLAHYYVEIFLSMCH